MGRMSIIFIFAACLAGSAAAQQPRYSDNWSNPDRRPQAENPVNAEIQKLTDELKKLIQEAERAQAADPRFLRDLRDLARRYAWPWRRQILRDDFSDGDWSRNPAWSVWGRHLRVDSWDGVSMRVVAEAPAPQRKNRNSDNRNGLAGVLGGVLDELQRNDSSRRDDRRSTAPKYTAAGMRAAAKVPNAFALRLTMSSATRGAGRFEVGVGQGKGNHGYRLAYNAGARPSLELLRVGSRGASVIEVADGPVKLEDGKKHVVQLTRGRGGQIVVSIDGKELLRVRDRSFLSDFDGVVLINKGGEYTIRSVALYGAG